MTDTIGTPLWTPDVTLTGGSWVADYPVTNLKTFPFARVARSTDTSIASTKFRGEFSVGRLVQMLWLCHHNLGVNATWRVRLFFKKADVQPIFDSGWADALPVIFDYDQVTWDGNYYWDRKGSDEERAGSPQDAKLYIPGNLTAEAFTVEIVDPTNPAGFIQMGMCWVSAAIDMPIGMAFGAQLGRISRTNITEAAGGIEYSERRPSARTFTCTLPAVARDYSLATFYELYRRNDIDGPIAWWPSREDAKNAARIAYVARLQQLDPISQAYTGHDVITLNGKELL